MLLTKCFFFGNLSLGDAEQTSSEAFNVVSNYLCCVDHCLESNQQFSKLCDLGFTEMLVGKHDGHISLLSM